MKRKEEGEESQVYTTFAFSGCSQSHIYLNSRNIEMRDRERRRRRRRRRKKGEQSNERPTEFVCALHFTFSAIYNKDEATAEPSAVSAVSKKGNQNWGYALAPSAYQFYDRSYFSLATVFPTGITFSTVTSLRKKKEKEKPGDV
jgi:hypothetical protein